MSALVPVSEQESVLTAVYNGWNSFSDGTQMFQHTAATLDGQPDVYAAEYVDGYIIGIDMYSNIFTMKAGDWTRTIIGKLEIDVSNLLAENGKLYFVDGWISGMFRYADLNRWQTVQDALIVQYWGRFMHSRGMVRDEYTGEVYALYDNDPTPGGNDGGHCRLVRLCLNNPDATFYGGGFIAEGSVLNSLFIR